MKRKIIGLSLFLAMSGMGIGQNLDNKFAIGTNTGVSDYHGELNQQCLSKELKRIV